MKSDLRGQQHPEQRQEPQPSTRQTRRQTSPHRPRLTGACLVVRYRSASGWVQAQLRWLALAGTGLPLTLLLDWTVGLLFGFEGGFDIILLIVYVAIPVAVAVAVLRYDLYDVERSS